MKTRILRDSVAAAVAALATVGCAHMYTRPGVNDGGAAPLVCTGTEQCSAAWGRAVAFVAEMSAYKIKTQSEYMIETEGPLGESPGLAMKVTKVPLGHGKTQIMFSAACANIFGCDPTPISARHAFDNYVLAGLDDVEPPIEHARPKPAPEPEPSMATEQPAQKSVADTRHPVKPNGD